MSASLLGTGGDAVTLPAGTSETTIFDGSVDGGPVRGYFLKNNSATLTAKIRVHAMHVDKTAEAGTDGMAALAPLESRVFVNEGGIDKISGYGSGGSLSLTGYVQKK